MSSIRRSIQVIDLLARKGPFGVRSIAQQLTLPLGSTQRILQDLADEGVIERTPAGEWELSYRLIELTGLQLERIQLPQLARPFAEDIARATQETVNINMLSGMSGLCIDKVRGNEGMQLDLRIGSHGPLYCGGAGKAMLAYMSEADRERVYGAPLTPLTPHTITDLESLRREVEVIRTRGYALDHDEVVVGVHCVGMPILDGNGRSVGAISITGPTPKRPGPYVDRLVKLLGEACGQVSRRLGYRGAFPPVVARNEVPPTPRRRVRA